MQDFFSLLLTAAIIAFDVSIMLNTLQELLANQFDASLCMLNLAIAHCPQTHWNQPVANLKFCQAAFHALFFTDLYLQPSDDTAAFKSQPFHGQHANAFKDYEEFEDRPQVHLYEKPLVLSYLQHARSKAQATIARESADKLAGPSGFHWRKCSRAELHVYNIRHIQHHAAQLSLRLRLDNGIDIPWVSHAWTDS